MWTWAYIPEIAYFVFNVSNQEAARDRRSVRADVRDQLRGGMWGVADAEPHREELAAGDVALIYLGPPERAFVARVGIASVVREWTPEEASVYPGDARSGVLLGHVEEWDAPVTMDAVVARIDPTGENPYVQENARNGFRNGVVAITEFEYQAVIALRAEASV